MVDKGRDSRTDLLDVEGFAKVLCVSPLWVRRRVADRSLASVRLGRMIRIPRAEVHRIVAEGLVRKRGQQEGRS